MATYIASMSRKMSIFVAALRQNRVMMDSFNMYCCNSFRRLCLLLLVSCPLLSLMSCQSGDDDAVVPEGQCTVTFSVSNYRQISFDDLSRAATRTEIPSDHPSTLAHLVLAVFDAETGEKACSPIQRDYSDYENNPYAYQQFSVTLPYGRYQVLVLGYNGSRACNIASLNHISWEDDYVPNTFLYCEEFALNEKTEPTTEVTLKHIVSAFRIETVDVSPAEIEKVRFTATAGGTVLDATTGFTPQNTGRTSEISVENKYVGKTCTFTVYLFLPEEQITTNYTVQAFGKNDVLINEKHFNEVPLRINYMTVWEGKLFEPSDDDDNDPSGVQRGFSIEWNTDWAGTLPI